jgi:hypothetical protein
MEITGVQTVGARSLGSVQVTVSDSSQAGNRAVATPSDRDSTPALPRSSVPETVVFPRDGAQIDRRPVQLRNARAAARYRRDGGDPKRRDANASR